MSWTRRTRFGALAVTVAATVIVGWHLVLTGLPATADLGIPALLTGTSLAIAIPGLIAEWRRPGDPAAWLVVVAGVATSLSYFRMLERPWAATMGAAAFFGLPLVVCHALLALPDGSERGARRRLVTACWVAPVILATGFLLTTGPRHTAPGLRAGGVRAASWVFATSPDGPTQRWFRQGNLAQRVRSDTVVWASWTGWSILVVGVGWLCAVALARRRTGATGPNRRSTQLRQFAAIAVAAGLSTLPLAAFPESVGTVAGVPVGSVFHGRWYSDLMTVAPALAASVVGGVLVWEALVRPRLTREADGSIQLDPSGGPSMLVRQVQRALADPTALVRYPQDDGSWVDDSGRIVEPAVEAERAATIVTRDGRAIAAVEHHESLLDQPDLLDVAVASVALALEANRHAALARASTDDIRSSAARLLDAAEIARRRVAKQIHDGPVKELASIDELLGQEPVPLGAVHASLRTAVAQVRGIAHGAAPVMLDGGLRAALDDLAAGAEVPVAIRELPAARLPDAVAITILLVAREALGGACGPVSLTVSVEGRSRDATDDVGHALLGVEGWTGPLDQPLGDRIGTLGGIVEAEPGRLTVALPLDAE